MVVSLKNSVLLLLCYLLFISPITIGGLIFNKVLPKNDSWYCESVVRAKKIKS